MSDSQTLSEGMSRESGYLSQHSIHCVCMLSLDHNPHYPFTVTLLLFMCLPHRTSFLFTSLLREVHLLGLSLSSIPETWAWTEQQTRELFLPSRELSNVL